MGMVSSPALCFPQGQVGGHVDRTSWVSALQPGSKQKPVKHEFNVLSCWNKLHFLQKPRARASLPNSPGHRQ